MLREAIAEADALFDHPIKQYAIFRAFEERIKERSIDNVPAELREKGRPAAYYGIFRLVKGEEYFQDLSQADHSTFIETAKEMDRIVASAMAEQSIDVTGMEAAIRKGLLPPLFKLVGIDDAKKIIEHVVHMVRFARTKSAAA